MAGELIEIRCPHCKGRLHGLSVEKARMFGDNWAMCDSCEFAWPTDGHGALIDPNRITLLGPARMTIAEVVELLLRIGGRRPEDEEVRRWN